MPDRPVLINASVQYILSQQFKRFHQTDLWENHRVTKVTFKSDRCKTDTCIVVGINSLLLPPATNIYGGLFTIEYQEKSLTRSLSFRVPADSAVFTDDTLVISIS